MRSLFLMLALSAAFPLAAHAEVEKVTITSRTVVADGHAFGATGPYEKLVGRIEFALDPANPHNKAIVDVEYAPRGSDGLVHFSSDLIVLRPVDPSKGNGVLFFEVANRGRLGLLGQFNGGRGGNDPNALADFGDGLLMRDGYTLVSVGWEIDVPRTLLRIDAPRATLPASTANASVSAEIMVNARTDESFLIDDPAGRPPVIYPPVNPANPADTLIVRDRFWDSGTVIPRDRWRFVSDASNLPKIQLDGGFDPGRYYRVTYHPTGALVAGAGLAAIRDAASAFRYRSDLPVHGKSTYVFGTSQTGRFLRQFLYDGFNADEHDRRAFDAVWAHIAGAARGSFNARFATPVPGAVFAPTAFPFTDDEETDTDGKRAGLQARYRPDQRPKVFYTNTPVEYWGEGRAAALTHTTIDGTRDVALPENVRSYFLAGTQHAPAPFPPRPLPPAAGQAQASNVRSGGQQLANPAPHIHVMKALLRDLHDWVEQGTAPPPSRYPRLGDGTLVPVRQVKFPQLSGVFDPRTISGPARLVGGKVVALPYLVPQTDADGIDLGGIRDPEVAVPLATTTGWNFRAEEIGNPGDIYQLLGSYIPFATTKARREAARDPRLSIEERYHGIDDYLQHVREAATELIRNRYMLQEDLDGVLARAREHWTFALGTATPSTGGR
jgi:alpha/beta hydrolase family protein